MLISLIHELLDKGGCDELAKEREAECLSLTGEPLGHGRRTALGVGVCLDVLLVVRPEAAVALAEQVDDVAYLGDRAAEHGVADAVGQDVEPGLSGEQALERHGKRERKAENVLELPVSPNPHAHDEPLVIVAGFLLVLRRLKESWDQRQDHRHGHWAEVHYVVHDRPLEAREHLGVLVVLVEHSPVGRLGRGGVPLCHELCELIVDGRHRKDILQHVADLVRAVLEELGHEGRREELDAVSVSPNGFLVEHRHDVPLGHIALHRPVHGDLRIIQRYVVVPAE